MTYQGHRGLAELIADVYQNDEQRLESILGARTAVSTEEWVHDCLDQTLNTNEIYQTTTFLRRFPLPIIIEIMKKLEINIDQITESACWTEILQSLNIVEINLPDSCHTDLDSIFRLEKECRTAVDPEHILGKGIAACRYMERLLKRLISFYGAFCFKSAFSTYCGLVKAKDQLSKNKLEKVLKNDCGLALESELKAAYVETYNIKLKGELIYFLSKRMDVSMGTLVNILRLLDEHTKSIERFRRGFGRNSILSGTEHIVSDETNDRPRRSRPSTDTVSDSLHEITSFNDKVGNLRPAEPKRVMTLLNKIISQRNPLPHDKPSHRLKTYEEVQQHVLDLFSAIHRFEAASSNLSLFPFVGRLVGKIEKLNMRGGLLEIATSSNERHWVPRDDPNSFSLGEVYCYSRTMKQFTRSSPALSYQQIGE